MHSPSIHNTHRRLPLLLASLLCHLLSMAQSDFRTPWISCPDLAAGEQAWFREVVELDERPAEARLTLITTGYGELFVNGWNVTTAVRQPYREDDDRGAALGITYDITRYLGAGSNVVAIHYSPAEWTEKPADRQVAAHLWGCYSNGSPFALDTDDDWLCRPAAKRLLKSGDERIDGRMKEIRDEVPTYGIACWKPVVSSPAAFDADDYDEPEDHSPADYVTHIVIPDYLIPTHEGMSCVFGMGFNGWLRVTLRKAKAGMKIRIDDTEYICSGAFDEQVCPFVAVRPHRIVHIVGDANFKAEMVHSVEGLIIGPRDVSPFE